MYDRISALYAYEKAFALMGAIFGSLCLVLGNNIYFSLSLIVTTLLYIFVIYQLAFHKDPLWQKGRILLCFGFMAYQYNSVRFIANSLGILEKDSHLLRIDEMLFGQTPAVWLHYSTSYWATEIFSVLYVTYLIYLFTAFFYSLTEPVEKTQRLAYYLFSAYVIGISLYVVVPAVGPRYAYPDLFSVALEQGTIAQAIDSFIFGAAPGYDVFPSLHMLITLVILDYDKKHHPWRFACMVVPAIGIFISTIYLRYHYGVDLIAGFVVFVVIRYGLWSYYFPRYVGEDNK